MTDIDQMLDDLHAALNGNLSADRERELLSKLESDDTGVVVEDASPEPDSWESRVNESLAAVNNDWLEVVATSPYSQGSSEADIRRMLDADGRATARANYEQSVIRAGAVIGERADQLIAERLAEAPPEDAGITQREVDDAYGRLNRRDPAAVAEYNNLVRRFLDQESTIRPHDLIRAQAYREVLNQVRPLGGATANLAGKRPNKRLSNQVSMVHDDTPAEWTAMVNEVSPPLNLKLKTGHRGYYTPSTETISSGGAASTMYHELGHRMETYIPQISVATNQFLERRTTLPNGEREQQLRYAKGEYVRADGFTEQYIGKDYSGISTEVFSTGVEALFAGAHGGLTSNARRKKDYSSDFEHRNLILGLYATALRGEQPKVDHRKHNMSYSALG